MNTTSVIKTFAPPTILLAVMISCTTSVVLNDSTTPTAGGAGGGTTGTGTGDGVIAGTDDVQLPAEATQSFFTAFQIDPVEEDTAGPKFVVAGDVDQDGLMDLVSAWNQSQPIQLHLQRQDSAGNISFRTITIAGTSPIAVVAGLQLGQINGDGWLDIVVLAKATGNGAFCPKNPPQEVSRLEGEIIVYFSPAGSVAVTDGDSWTQMILSNPYVSEQGGFHNQFPGAETKPVEEAKTFPEWSGFTDLVVADIDGQPGDDIIVALNPAECEELNQSPPINTVDLWLNPGPAMAAVSSAWGIDSGEGFSRGVPLALMVNAPQVKDIEVMDVDGDGDLDVIATWTNMLSQNIMWVRNPLVPHQPGGPGGVSELTRGFPSPGFSLCAGGLRNKEGCDTDADCAGGIFPGSNPPQVVPDGKCPPPTWRDIALGWEPRPIGQVDTAADIIALGDIDDDGAQDIVVRSTIGRIVQWFRHPNNITVAPEFPPSDPIPNRFNFPWPVFTLTEFDNSAPEAIAVGDITNDGLTDLVVAAEGGVFWLDSTVSGSVFDPWFPNPIIQDMPLDVVDSPDVADDATPAPGSGVGVESVDVSTVINTLLIVDLDGDGKNDIVGTLDRRAGSGLSDDRLVWYRNVRTTP